MHKNLEYTASHCVVGSAFVIRDHARESRIQNTAGAHNQKCNGAQMILRFEIQLDQSRKLQQPREDTKNFTNQKKPIWRRCAGNEMLPLMRFNL